MESTAQPATGASPAREVSESPDCLDLLPDDAVVEVLRHLGDEDLLECRLVCKRLRDLVMLPSVWRHVRVETPSCLVLCRMPRLASLRVDAIGRCNHLLTTRCAVRELILFGGDDDAKDSDRKMQIMAVQESLGQLRRLELDLDYSDSGPHVRVAWLQAIASVSGLEFLEVGVNSALTRGYSLYPAPMASSLKTFWCTAYEGMDAFVNCILATHASTLEDVSAMTWICSFDTARLLGGMPNLRSVSCKILPGMDALLECGSLRDLEVILDCEWQYDDTDDDEIWGVVELLRRANQLSFLCLILETDSEGAIDFLAEMVDALGSSVRARLEEFRISLDIVSCRLDAHLPVQVSLLRALPMLPALRELKVDWESDELLQGITPKTAPSLRSLTLQLPLMTRLKAWVLKTSTRKLLLQNSSLHVKATDYMYKNTASLVSHSLDHCPSVKYHSAENTWIYFDRDEN
ncbi:uncharacterized protein LOC127750277 isoform X3 [Frankliniella occidentalis]|uniref:Uncharacterized protein LOC127750277 isoform X3 n=1 Tax=Frankliniella occidentalis TaxID=133901 RepID=A0A9C6XQF9_FRAOC|nr:uncharacterized protein LOC127750277 isoform X3 [Frankliniella occidentalis]